MQGLREKGQARYALVRGSNSKENDNSWTFQGNDDQEWHPYVDSVPVGVGVLKCRLLDLHHCQAKPGTEAPRARSM